MENTTKKAKASSTVQARKRSTKGCTHPAEEISSLYYRNTMFHLERIHRNTREIVLAESLDHCMQKGLLPQSVAEAVNAAYFISGVVELAQRAHCVSGVPASVLIARATFENGWLTDDLQGEKGATYFFDLGKRLAKNRSFQPVLEASGNQDALVAALMECEDWEQLDREDVITPIINFHLAECDAFGNKYRAEAAARKTKRKSSAGSAPLKDQPTLLYIPVEAPTAAAAQFMRKNQGALTPLEIFNR